ncbi:MAG: [FeFe] hydrogenase H-cluster radical SAM maturase HydG [Candidatus Omnitrophica bacterium]|nr:[FeFe] hydrogenase H-cluster radical SAM maturase HydG [Candidatus Omnitrophota bacterium]
MINTEISLEKIIIPEQVNKYLVQGKDFVAKANIEEILANLKPPDRGYISQIIEKARSIQTLELEEAASLMAVSEQDIWQRIFEAAQEIKKKVYDNRIVTFAPLYISNLCVNNCIYCGFRKENHQIQRKFLTQEEIRQETERIAGTIGHKRVIAVFGEHPLTNINYICESLRTIYSVKIKVRNGIGQIRRVNVNAAPMSIQDLYLLKKAGIGTYQVFQETYHRSTYEKLHPADTIKGNYRWRLYSLHRAMEAGIDDVAIGALFGLYDWRYEVLGMLAQARDLERCFGVGPHTVSVPRIEPAINTPFCNNPPYRVKDEDFRKLIAVLRLSIPYAGLIITCREKAEFIRSVIGMCTQRDASSRIGVGSYSQSLTKQQPLRQQFILGDSRSLDEVIRELADLGYITSFCTAGYRCGRTGDTIMNLLRSGKEGCFCKLNAVLTFQEWLEDFASFETKKIGEALIAREIEEIRTRPKDFPLQLYQAFLGYLERIKRGERDLWF